ncbi:PLP-dependent aminotransferase family protein [Dyella jiangningensis]|uniref:MocR-like pyridoxine biosynthesis transcription factor PdxR n=1 Tax=Dyella jiangningensis TaxID=1379159 RepID=UPI00240F2805|nr:PLP-dependent aminotransferase family protein [Dyella jiangningensis]MDG2538284.1 PLP-dependent aminotransferase family protein [Dyella jiangningensis]
MTRASTSFLPPVAVDPASDTPMYQQLSDWFRRAILDGHLRPGQAVPSTRSLAGELRISRIPVLSAYDQLLAEGYLETFTGSGTRVARAIPHTAPAAKRHRASDDGDGPSPASRRISRRSVQLHGPEQTWLDSLGAFRVGMPALDRFPTAVWARLVNRHARALSVQAMSYGDPAGDWPLREAVASYLGMSRSVRCDASQVLITTGSQQALQICAHVLLDEGDRVWMEEPGYPGAHQAFRTAGAQMVPVPVDGDGIDVEAGIRRARGARAVYISPSHQFPLGTTMSAARRMQLLAWAERDDAWIIEDDYDSEYRFGGKPVASLQGLDTAGRVIYLGTFSKVMYPALRVGYMVVPKDLVPAFHAGRDAIDTFSSTLFQLAMTDFIREGHFARHIRVMRALYRERRQALIQAVERWLGGRLRIIGADAGMQLVGLLPEGTDDVALSREAATHGVSVRPLSPCYLEPPGRAGLILGYGGVSPAQIDEGMRRLGQCRAFSL